MELFEEAGHAFAHDPLLPSYRLADAQRAGIAPAAIDAIRTGATPQLAGAQLAVYRFSALLLKKHEVDDETYSAAVHALGREGVVDLVGILGYYGLISMTIKAFRVAVPAGSPDLFAVTE